MEQEGPSLEDGDTQRRHAQRDWFGPMDYRPGRLGCRVERLSEHRADDSIQSRLKRMMYNHYLRYPQSTAKSFFQPDHLHPNARGHVSPASRSTGRLSFF